MDTPRLIRLVRFSFPHKMQRVFDKLKSRAIKKKKRRVETWKISKLIFIFFFFIPCFHDASNSFFLEQKKNNFESFREKLFDNILITTLEVIQEKYGDTYYLKIYYFKMFKR